MKPWQRIAGLRPIGAAGSYAGGAPDLGADTRGAFDELRQSFGAELQREPGSSLLVRSSLETLLGAFVTRAQQSRGAVGLIAFELEDWKSHGDRIGAAALAGAFSSLAAALRRRVRASDELGRLGEAQLAAVLPGCEPAALPSVTERLRMSLEAFELSLGSEPFRPAFSAVWIAAAPGPPDATASRLLDDLGAALERARGGDLG